MKRIIKLLIDKLLSNTVIGLIVLLVIDIYISPYFFSSLIKEAPLAGKIILVPTFSLLVVVFSLGGLDSIVYNENKFWKIPSIYLIVEVFFAVYYLFQPYFNNWIVFYKFCLIILFFIIARMSFFDYVSKMNEQIKTTKKRK